MVPRHHTVTLLLQPQQGGVREDDERGGGDHRRRLRVRGGRTARLTFDHHSAGKKVLAQV